MMTDIAFERNDRKATENRIKHGVSFDEAKFVFLNENARLILDPEQADGEDRFVLLGLSMRTRLLVVSIVVRMTMRRLGSFPLAKLIGPNVDSMESFCDEKIIRLFKIEKESISQETETSTDDPA